MDWTKISPEVYRENGNYVIPYIKGSEGPVNAVDMFGTPGHYASITFELAIFKGWLGVYPLWRLPHTLDEFAAFSCNDWTTWQGQEFGWRFPMHLPKNWCTVYAQHPYGRFLWFDIPIRVKNIDEFHKYTMEFIRGNDCMKTLFRIDGHLKFAYTGKNFNLPNLPVLTAHTRYDGDFGYKMILKPMIAS